MQGVVVKQYNAHHLRLRHLGLHHGDVERVLRGLVYKGDVPASQALLDLVAEAARVVGLVARKPEGAVSVGVEVGAQHGGARPAVPWEQADDVVAGELYAHRRRQVRVVQAHGEHSLLLVHDGQSPLVHEIQPVVHERGVRPVARRDEDDGDLRR